MLLVSKNARRRPRMFPDEPDHTVAVEHPALA
jgi:hypothetical protein